MAKGKGGKGARGKGRGAKGSGSPLGTARRTREGLNAGYPTPLARQTARELKRGADVTVKSQKFLARPRSR
jgi:hypothetical protein